jgi:hypothetical protein
MRIKAPFEIVKLQGTSAWRGLQALAASRKIIIGHVQVTPDKRCVAVISRVKS